MTRAPDSDIDRVRKAIAEFREAIARLAPQVNVIAVDLQLAALRTRDEPSLQAIGKAAAFLHAAAVVLQSTDPLCRSVTAMVAEYERTLQNVDAMHRIVDGAGRRPKPGEVDSEK